jgi:(p)ppGpp synthase/HD superfamily hydrolase
MTGFSPTLERALRTAFHLHGGQMRKTDPTLPYLTHLMHVALIVQRFSFPENYVAAALLHDTVEDTQYTPEELLEEFGEDICSIVLEVTENRALRYVERKRGYLDSVRNGSEGAKAVCCADKTHNLATILDAWSVKGDAIWTEFSRGPELTMQFYRDALAAIEHGWTHPIVEAYRDVVRRIPPLGGPLIA